MLGWALFPLYCDGNHFLRAIFENNEAKLNVVSLGQKDLSRHFLPPRMSSAPSGRDLGASFTPNPRAGAVAMPAKVPVNGTASWAARAMGRGEA